MGKCPRQEDAKTMNERKPFLQLTKRSTRDIDYVVALLVFYGGPSRIFAA
jgi:hypothetical protein